MYVLFYLCTVVKYFQHVLSAPDVDGKANVVQGESDDEHKSNNSSQRLEDYFAYLDCTILLPVERHSCL